MAFPGVVGTVELVQNAGLRQAKFRRTFLVSSYSLVATGTKTPVARRVPATRRQISPIPVPICFEEDDRGRVEPVQSSLVPQYGQKLVEACSSPWHTGHFIHDQIRSWIA